MVAVIGRMERDGVKVDREVLKGLSAEFNAQIADLEEKICGEAGCKFTIGSPQQLGDILFNKMRSEEHTSELQSLMRLSYAVFCLKKKKTTMTKRTQQILKNKTY